MKSKRYRNVINKFSLCFEHQMLFHYVYVFCCLETVCVAIVDGIVDEMRGKARHILFNTTFNNGYIATDTLLKTIEIIIYVFNGN